jgi:hypothetical protein
VRVFVELTGAIGFATVAVGVGLVVVAVAVGFVVGVAEVVGFVVGVAVVVGFVVGVGVGVSLAEIDGVGDGEIDVVGSVRTASSREAGFSNSVGGDVTRTIAVPVTKPSRERTRYLNIAPP